MDPALISVHPGYNAAKVFVRRLGISAFFSPLLEFFGKSLIARIVFVSNGYRHHVEGTNVIGKGDPSLLLAHIEHFDYSWICLVQSIFGAAFTLGNPNGTASLQTVVDIARQVLISPYFLADTSGRSIDDKALVEPQQHSDERALKQIIPDGDLYRLKPIMKKGIVHDGGVHNNIAMVGNEQVCLFRIQAAHARYGELSCGTTNYLVQITFKEYLDLLDAIDVPDLLGQEVFYDMMGQTREKAGSFRKPERADRPNKLLISQETLYGRPDFGVIIGANIIKGIQCTETFCAFGALS